jgi:hypothetical protein
MDCLKRPPGYGYGRISSRLSLYDTTMKVSHPTDRTELLGKIKTSRCRVAFIQYIRRQISTQPKAKNYIDMQITKPHEQQT